ncbi:MAG: hypothetical protein KGI73_01625 [Patescibacteria group bacterium]|nr:hypothetical protein [Patescibacteria group bacterium]
MAFERARDAEKIEGAFTRSGFRDLIRIRQDKAPEFILDTSERKIFPGDTVTVIGGYYLTRGKTTGCKVDILLSQNRAVVSNPAWRRTRTIHGSNLERDY